MSPVKTFLALGLALTAAYPIASVAQGAAATSPAPPATKASPDGTKIGIVNIQAAIAECAEGKKEFDALQQKFTPKQTELKNLNDEVENLKKQLQAQGDKLNDGEKGARARAIDSKQKSLQRNYEDAQAEFQQAEQEVINRLGAKMLAVLEKYATANGFSVVLDVSNPQTSPVLYATQTTIITKELVDAYNAENSAGTVAAPKPAAPAGKPATSAPTPKKP